MKIFFTSLIAALLSFTAHAQMTGVVGGLNITDFDADGYSYEGDIGFQGGVRYMTTLSGLTIRTGAELRWLGVSDDDADAETTILQLYSPITAQFAATESVNLFFGPGIGLSITDDCEVAGADCTGDGVESIVVNLELGAAWRANDTWTIEGFYDLGLTEYAESTDGTVFGLQAVYEL